MATRAKSKFRVGEYIVHHYYGVGQIEDILQKGLDEDRKVFYRIQTKTNTYWLPVGDEDSDRIDRLRDKKAFHKALNILTEDPQLISEDNKSRKKVIQDRWKEGNLDSRARLMRDLNYRRTGRLLNFDERQLLESIQNQFIDEWLLVDPSLNRSDAKKRIDRALEEE